MILETVVEKRRRVRSLWIIYITVFNQSIGFSIVLTSIWPYLQHLQGEPRKEWLGWVIASSPIGQLIFSPLIGWLCTFLRSIRLPSIFCLLLFILSNLWYILLFLHGKNRTEYFMMLTRFLTGLAGGIITPCRTFVTQETLVGERTPALAYLSLAQAVGYMVGPAIQVALTKLGPDGILLGGEVRLSMYTGPGWVAIMFGLVNLVLFHPSLFRESHIAAKEYGLVDGEGGMVGAKDVNWSHLPPDYVGIFITVVCFFSAFFNFALLESVGMPMIMDQLGLTEAEAIRNFGITLTITSIISTSIFSSIGLLSKRFDERKLLIFCGFLPTVLGRLCFFPYPGPVAPMKGFGCFLPSQNGSYSDDVTFCESNGLKWTTVEPGCPREQSWCFTLPALRPSLILVGFLTVTLGFPFCLTIPQALYSKLLGPRPQGTWNGMLAVIVSLSKIVGTITLTHIYQNYGTGVTSGLVTGVVLISLCSVAGWYRRLVPFQLPPSSRPDVVVEGGPKLATELN